MTDESSSPSRQGPDPPDGTVRSEYDWSSISPSTAVVESVAAAVDRETTDLDSLYASLDPDALDTLVGADRTARVRGDTAVSFTFAGRRVTVDSTGEVLVEPGTSQDSHRR